MNIKKIANLLLNFTINRIVEIFGLAIALAGLFLFVSLTSYSPNDPNFIFPENTEINNLLGFQGSFISDLFLQSIGLVSYLVSITLTITGINILKTKEFFLIIENIFFTILYVILASIFLTYFYSNAFTLYINGNGGFVGNYFNETLLNSLININKNLAYYLIVFLILLLFLISINFSLVKFLKFFGSLSNLLFKNRNKNYTDKTEIINEYIPQDEIKNLIQEDLPFIKAENKKDNKIKFKLPDLELLKIPSKKEREGSKKKRK